MDYAILAAGMGSRLASEGLSVPKPLIPIMGKPMIGRLIDILMSCGAGRINVVANSRMPELVEYLEGLKQAGLPVDVRPIISDNSYYSLSEACKGLDSRFIAMTVDAIFPTAEFRRYVDAVSRIDDSEVLMGLTRFVDDESPLYARIGETGEVIDYRYGGEPYAEGTIVSAGLYGLTAAAMKYVEDMDKYPESLSDFQRILAAESPIKVVPYEFSKALDVDHNTDIAVAESFLSEVNAGLES